MKKTIPELFEEQVFHTPDHVAVVGQCPGKMMEDRGENPGLLPGMMIYVTYRELNQRADQLAYYLKINGVAPDTIAAVFVERSIEAVVGILAVLKAGGSYLPVDPEYPEQRIAYMLADSSVKVLVTTRTLAKKVEKFRSLEVETMFIEDIGRRQEAVGTRGKKSRGEPCVRPSITPQPLNFSTSQPLSSSSLAYIIYTSGSTGRPKGVLVEHRCVVRLVKKTNYIDFDKRDKLLMTGALEFDASTFEIWGALLNGWVLYLVDKDTILLPQNLKLLVRTFDIGTMWLTSPLFNRLSLAEPEIFSNLRHLLVGGDVLSPVHINRIKQRFSRLNIINGYGPTENTTFSTTFLIDKKYETNIPIGKPIPGSTAYIMDNNRCLQAVKKPGELWVGGDGVARGYLNDPELTAEKFINAECIAHSKKRKAQSKEFIARPKASTKPTPPLRGTPPVEGNPEHFIVSSLKVLSARSPLERGSAHKIRWAIRENATIRSVPPLTGPPQAGRGVLKSSQKNEIFTNSSIKEKSEERYVPDAMRYALCDSPQSGVKLYRTGDLACWLPGGNIEFIARIDNQVKIRGFRIELGEIENQLLHHDKIEEAVALALDDGIGEKYLCAYLVAKSMGDGIKNNNHGGTSPWVTEDPRPVGDVHVSPGNDEVPSPKELKEFLSCTLPDYMIPLYFVFVEKIPLTANGKVDRTALPQPAADVGREYTAPRNATEQVLLETCSEVLSRSSIGIDDDFFELGGHSLTAAMLITKLHQRLNVRLPLSIIFENPTVRELSAHITAAAKDQYNVIPCVEAKRYYRLSASQRSLYIMHQLDPESIVYNMQHTMLLEGALDKEKLERSFLVLIRRHESLRTSFHMINNEPVQKIHYAGDIAFKIEYYENIRPFDLTSAPLLRAVLIRLEEEEHILLVDMHHIIYDGISIEIFIREFMLLYKNRAGETLHPLKLQFKDFSEWENNRRESGFLKFHEAFWLEEFKEGVPVLNLPGDRGSASNKNPGGSSIDFVINSEESRALKELALAEGATLFMVLLAVFNILLARVCNQEDIVLGIPTAGRSHADLEGIVGLFINMLVLKNRPTEEKKFSAFLRETKERTLRAYENQDYRYEELLEQLLLRSKSDRHSLFDVVFLFQNIENLPGNISEMEIPGLKLKPMDREYEVSNLPHEMILVGYESGEKLRFLLSYRTSHFKAETIKLLVGNFNRIISAVLGNKHIKIKDIFIDHGLISAAVDISQEGAGDFNF